jgi:vancomycin resistance protein YoaR
LIGIGSLVFVVLLAVLVDTALYYNRVHDGISVAGIDVGGKTEEEAIASLAAVVDESRRSPITVTDGTESWTLMPDDAGTHMNVEKAVTAALALSRDGNIFSDIGKRWKLYFSPRDVPLTGTVDAAKLAAFVAGIAQKLDVEPVNASLAMKNGTVSVIKSAEGQAVDQASLTQELNDLLVSQHSTTVPIPMTVTEPAVTAEDNAEAQRQAETMVSASVTVTDGDKHWTVTAGEIASYMSFTSEMKNGVSTLVPFMDSTKLKPLLDEIAPDVVTEPMDASFAHDSTHAWVVAGKNGEQLDAEATAAAITAATLEPTARTVKIVVKAKEPEFTTEEAKAWGITDKLSSCTTTYACDEARQANVIAATKYGTNVFLAPGEEYDFDKQIGPREPERGFRLAPGIVGPGKLEDVYGGGICQVSTTMFNAVADKGAGLKITERRNHSLFINHYPLGRDATVTAGGKNLRFVNDTDHYIWITGTSNGVKTTITVWGTDQGRTTKWTIGEAYDVVPVTKTTVTDPTMAAGTTKVVADGQKGWRLKTTRVVTERGTVIHKDVWTNYWPMYPEKVKVGTATTKPPTTTTTETQSKTTESPPASSTTTTTGAG